MAGRQELPSSKRVLKNLQDISSYSILKRIKARGAVVCGCGTCRGCRANGAYQVENWGGPRDKIFSVQFMHPDTVSVVEEQIKYIVSK
eukprot:13062748-Ditylum_brightwellii.AAC.1